MSTSDFVMVDGEDSSNKAPTGELKDPGALQEVLSQMEPSVKAKNDSVLVKPGVRPVCEKTTEIKATPTQPLMPIQPTSTGGSKRNYGEAPRSTVLQYRSVVIVGDIGSGKKTVAKRLVGCDFLPAEFESAVQRHYVRKLQKETNNFRYSISMLDVVSLCASYEKAQCTLKDYVLELNIEGVNVILFVLRREQFTDEGADGFLRIIRNFKPEVANISAMIITGCENLDREARKRFVKEFPSNPTRKEIADFMQKGIFTVGFPDLSSEGGGNITVCEENIRIDEKTLQELVKNCKQLHLTSELLHDQKDTWIGKWPWCSLL